MNCVCCLFFVACLSVCFRVYVRVCLFVVFVHVSGLFDCFRLCVGLCVFVCLCVYLRVMCVCRFSVCLRRLCVRVCVVCPFVWVLCVCWFVCLCVVD